MNKKFGYVAVAALGALALLGVTALPASAAATGDTDVTFTLTGGTLDITPAASAALTNGATGDDDVSGSLGAVGVSDTRGSIAGWIITASSTTFSDGVGSAFTGVSYNSGSATATTGFITAGSAGEVSIDNAVPVAEGTAAVGNNTASFTPTLTVTLPTMSLAGNYTGTVTTSIA